MARKISLIGHISQLKSSDISKICKRLFETTPINYFCYLRRYKNGNFTFLPSAIDLGSYFFEDGIYPYTWLAGVPFEELQSGYSFWDIAKQVSVEESKGISQDLAKLFNLSSGIEIIEKFEKYCDFYSFSSNHAGIYFISLQFLYQFIYYFKQECQHLLLTAYEDRLQLDHQEIILPPIPIMSMNSDEPISDDEEFPIKRYYLNGEYTRVFLTRREVEILRKMSMGETVKVLADALFISPRTLEHHITNIKDKLNVSRTAEILHIARINKIIT
jgi:DNA-binding CsgD family transcriptional regulator